MKAARAAALAASVALMVPLLWPIVSGVAPSGDDLGRFHAPIRAFYSRCLAAGDSPLWHPGLYCGFYVHGEGQAGMDHPLHRLLYSRLPWTRAFAVEVVIGYPLLFLGMVAWLRRVGLRSEAALVGAMTFTFSGFMLFRYVHTNAIQVAAHLPWILLAVEWIAEDRCRLKGGATLALLTASQGLLGYPQYVGFSLLVSTSYAAVRLWPLGPSRTPDLDQRPQRPKRVWAGLPVYGLAIGLGLLTAAAQILPQLDALADSTRSRPTLSFLGRGSLHPLNLAQIILPFGFRSGFYDPDGRGVWPRHESVAYLGAIMPSLFTWLWIRRHSLGPLRRLALWAAAVGIGALILALGHYSPMFSLYARLPGASVFRYPARYVLVSQFAASVLGAIAFGDLLSVCRDSAVISRKSLLPMLAPVAVALLAVSALLLARLLRPEFVRVASIAGIGDLSRSVAWVGVPGILVVLAIRGRRVAPAMLIAVIAVDSLVFAMAPIVRHELTDRRSGPPSPGPGRSLTPRNESLTDGGQLVRGYVALTPRRRLDYEKDSSLRLAGAVRRLDDSGRWSSLQLDPLPRARLVGQVFVSHASNEDLDRIDPESTALAEEPISLGGGERGSATITTDRPGRIAVTTEASRRRLLVVSESFHEGWLATIDGQPARPIRANGDFIGIAVDSGRHTVALEFAPSSSRIGRAISLAGFAAILVMLLCNLRWPTPGRSTRKSASARHHLRATGLADASPRERLGAPRNPGGMAQLPGANRDTEGTVIGIPDGVTSRKGVRTANPVNRISAG